MTTPGISNNSIIFSVIFYPENLVLSLILLGRKKKETYTPASYCAHPRVAYEMNFQNAQISCRDRYPAVMSVRQAIPIFMQTFFWLCSLSMAVQPFYLQMTIWIIELKKPDRLKVTIVLMLLVVICGTAYDSGDDGYGIRACERCFAWPSMGLTLPIIAGRAFTLNP